MKYISIIISAIALLVSGIVFFQSRTENTVKSSEHTRSDSTFSCIKS